MTIAQALLRAKNVGIRNAKNKLSKLIKQHELWIITEHGTPTSVLLPYEDLLDLVDVIDELQDKGAIETVMEGRKAIESKSKGRSVLNAFKTIGTKKK